MPPPTRPEDRAKASAAAASASWAEVAQEVDSVKALLHALRTQPRGFDLLLLDLMMPEVSGYDVLREMTLTGLGADVPVLVLTNFPEARNSEEQRLLKDGLVLDVVAKTAVHDNPMLLAHLVEWHLQVSHDETDGTDEGLQEAA